jgi:hypothetical protein
VTSNMAIISTKQVDGVQDIEISSPTITGRDENVSRKDSVVNCHEDGISPEEARNDVRGIEVISMTYTKLSLIDAYIR